MKKVFFLAIALAFTNLIFEQTEQGKFVLSGATGLQFISSNIDYEYDGQSLRNVTQSSFSIMPSIGYFVMDNLAVGLSANFSSTTQKNEGAKYTVSSTMLLPTAIYYFPVEGQFKPLLQVGAGLMSTKEKDSYNGDTYEDKMSGLALNFGGGAAYFINDYVSLNFGLSYTMANLKYSDDSDAVQKQGNFAANIGFSVFL
jgi:outer membrane protein